MKGFNLSDWALNHRSLVWYFMLIFTVAGVFAYLNLGREEDPPFTIKTMVVKTLWPEIPASTPVSAVVASLAVAAVTGVVFGLLPAIRASRLDPVAALRYE